MEEVKDITSLEDVKRLVDLFYDKVKRDELLAPIFNERIQDQWPKHLEKMYAFWQTVLLNEPVYSGSPFPPHSSLPIHHAHFERWMELFIQTIDSLFKGESKIEYYRNRGSHGLL